MSVKLVCNALINGEHVSPLKNISNIVYTTKRAGQQVFESQSPGQTKDKLLCTWSQKSKVYRSKNIASVLSNIPIHLMGSESLLIWFIPDKLLLKWQVTSKAGGLRLWREAAVLAALLHLENPLPNGRASSDDLPCNTARIRRAASLHRGTLHTCDSQPLSQKQIKEKRRKWRSNVSVERCYPREHSKGWWSRNGWDANMR